MKKFVLPIFILCLLSGPQLHARVTAVTIFPDGATVTSAQNFAAGNQSFHLPQQAVPRTLSVACRDKRFRITALTWKRDDAGQQEAVATLLKEIEALQEKRAREQNGLDAAAAEVAFWQAQTKRSWDKAQDALAIAEALKQPLLAALAEKLEIETTVGELDRQLAQKQAQLQQIRGGDQKPWRIDLQLEGPLGGKTRLEWSCFVGGCGFEPLYRLDARPDQQQIFFSLDAKIWQHTAEQWQDAEIRLASVKPSFSLDPPANDPWIVSPLKVFPSRKIAAFEAATDAGMAQTLSAPAGNEIRKATYTEWNLGRLSLKPGEPLLVPVKSAVWVARFHHLLRPEKSPLAYLEAAVTLDEALDVPLGSALYLVDGTLVGRQAVSLRGKDLSLFFGVDQLVSARRSLTEYKTGTSGLLKGRKSWHWVWETVIANGRSQPVNLNIEESRPQVRSEKIELEIIASPEISQQTPEVLIRELELAGGKTATLALDVRIQAPADMEISPGR